MLSGFSDLLTLRPDLGEEWDYKRNIILIRLQSHYTATNVYGGNAGYVDMSGRHNQTIEQTEKGAQSVLQLNGLRRLKRTGLSLG